MSGRRQHQGNDEQSDFSKASSMALSRLSKVDEIIHIDANIKWWFVGD
jgi:hypothetical protein